MRNIVYYVATSLDGYIAGDGGDVSLFAQGGEGVNKYFEDLKDYKTVIMGRKTYEFGFQFGLQPGQPAYPHMKHYVFSSSLKLDETDPLVEIREFDIDFINELKSTANSDIYLCGGGTFAGFLFDNGLIDVAKLKVNPIVLGSGVKLFGESNTAMKWKLTDHQLFDDGLSINTYDLRN